MTRFLVGTASWTDPTLLKSSDFYPPGCKTAEERLRFYAAQFETVEVDASYYTLLAERTAQLWIERTPPEFIFHIKAYSLLTGHGAEIGRMPANLRDLLSAREKTAKRLEHPSPEVLDLAFQMFWSSLEPLRREEKLGMLLFQFPPFFTCRGSNFDYLVQTRQRLPEARLAIEFRHPSWVSAGQRSRTMDFLREHGLYYVSVDAPEAPSTVPSFIECTGPELYLRMHGKNLENWYKKGITVAERYKYLYSERELENWAGKVKQLRNVDRAHVIFNNCYRNFGVMNATTMRQILGR